MKYNLLIFALTFSGFCAAQVTLEHTYPIAAVNRVKLEVDGVKYYYADPVNRQLLIFNEDHSLWKTVDLDIDMDTIISLVVSGLSQHRLIADNEIEYIYYAYGKKNGSFTSKSGTMNLSGTFFSNTTGFFYMVNGVEKLVSGSTVFTLPGMIPEHSYPGVDVRRVDDAFDVYVVRGVDKIELYRDDHTLWKTVNFNFWCDDCFPAVMEVSQTAIDPDSLVEIVLSEQTNNPLKYLIGVIKEDGTLLFEYQGGDDERIYADLLGPNQGFDGYKLALDMDDLDSTLIYHLPDFTLEKTLNFHYKYKNTNQEGVKFFPYNTRPGTTEMSVLNPSDYSVWHTCPKPAGETWLPSSFSRYLFDTDDDVEFDYLFTANDQTYGYRLRDETDGSLLIDEPNMWGTYLSYLPGAPVKLVCWFRNYYPNQVSVTDFTQIYGINASTGLNIAGGNDLELIASPNPGIGDLWINFTDAPSSEVEVQVFDLGGRSTFSQIFSPAESLLVPQTAFGQPGIYLVEVRADGIRTVLKVVR